jgi:regulator of protease activity HflC (stomatin/prohibitin superfamily)
MPSISRYPLVHHLRADPNQYILHYRGGKLIRRGIGLAYWFNPLAAAIAQVPAEDCETTFMLSERTADLQEVAVQVTVTYRFSDPERVATRVNFAVSTSSGAWIEQPLQRVASLWRQRAQQPVRATLSRMDLVTAVRAGALGMRDVLDAALRADEEIAALGMALVSVQVDRVAASGELEKALQTPTRESLQQKADEAVFSRRALAVEKERAIKENEIATEVELARRQEELIRRQGANRLLEVREEAESERARVEAAAARKGIEAKADADAHRLLTDARAEGDRSRVAAWSDAPGRVHLGLALQEMAAHVQTVQHLNVTPDLFAQAFQQFLTDRGTGADGA